LIRGTFRYAGRQHRDAIAKAIKPIYTAVNAAAAKEVLEAFDAEWGARFRSPRTARTRSRRSPTAGLPRVCPYATQRIHARTDPDTHAIRR
jgi:transposase-like protein